MRMKLSRFVLLVAVLVISVTVSLAMPCGSVGGAGCWAKAAPPKAVTTTPTISARNVPGLFMRFLLCSGIPFGGWTDPPPPTHRTEPAGPLAALATPATAGTTSEPTGLLRAS